MAISNILRKLSVLYSTLDPFINIHYFARSQVQRNPRPEDGVFHLQGFQTSRLHSSDHAQGWLHLTYQIFNVGSWLYRNRTAWRHPTVNRVNADSALFSEPVAVLSVFLEPFLDVTFWVHSLELSYRKRENKRWCIQQKKVATPIEVAPEYSREKTLIFPGSTCSYNSIPYLFYEIEGSMVVIMVADSGFCY